MDNNTTTDKQPDKPLSKLEQQRAENMAYAAQSVVVNIGANIFEPPVNYYIQKKYAQKTGAYSKHAKMERYGRIRDNYVGELAGDIVGSSTLFLASSFAPQTTQNFISGTGKLLHPIFHTVGHAVFNDEFNEPDYQAKVQKWSTFQERNFARSMIVGVANISANVATQKYVMRNPSPAKVIFAGKMAGITLTTSLMLAARIFAPQKMKDLDKRMGQKYFANNDKKNEKEAQQPASATDSSNYQSMTSAPVSYTTRLQLQDVATLPPLEPTR